MRKLIIYGWLDSAGSALSNLSYGLHNQISILVLIEKASLNMRTRDYLCSTY